MSLSHDVPFLSPFFFFFFFNDTATTEIYTLSLHDALPICWHHARFGPPEPTADCNGRQCDRLFLCRPPCGEFRRSEEHTYELQSQFHLVCRLLLDKKKKKK